MSDFLRDLDNFRDAILRDNVTRPHPLTLSPRQLDKLEQLVPRQTDESDTRWLARVYEALG